MAGFLPSALSTDSDTGFCEVPIALAFLGFLPLGARGAGLLVDSGVDVAVLCGKSQITWSVDPHRIQAPIILQHSPLCHFWQCGQATDTIGAGPLNPVPGELTTEGVDWPLLGAN